VSIVTAFKAEHAADAVATMYAGFKTPAFKQFLERLNDGNQTDTPRC
jgi:hypothetical protein